MARPRIPADQRRRCACLYIWEAQLDALRLLAEQRGTSMAEIAREVIQAGLNATSTR